jgi:hypothetical protein
MIEARMVDIFRAFMVGSLCSLAFARRGKHTSKPLKAGKPLVVIFLQTWSSQLGRWTMQ